MVIFISTCSVVQRNLSGGNNDTIGGIDGDFGEGGGGWRGDVEGNEEKVHNI